MPKRVLVIDDDPLSRAYLEAILGTAGHIVLFAVDGPAGVKAAIEEQPDAILCDIVMPGLDGFRVLQKLRLDARTVATPFLIVTGVDNGGVRERVRQMGGDDCLQKPFQPAQVLDALHRALRKRGAVIRVQDTPVDFEIGGDVQAQRASPDLDVRPTRTEQRHAAILMAEIINFAALADGLRGDELAALVARFAREMPIPVTNHGGWIARVDGGTLVAAFDSAGRDRPDHAWRAVRAALFMSLAGDALRRWLVDRFPERRQVPAFAIGLHLGDVILDLDTKQVSGDTVDGCRGILQCGRPLFWSITASRALLRAAGPGVHASESLRFVRPAGRLEVAEVTGIGLSEAALRAEPVLSFLKGLPAVLAANGDLLARDATRAQQHTGNVWLGRQQQIPIEIPGFTLRRKIGEGAHAQVFLAAEEASGQTVVLKVLDNFSDALFDSLQHFIAEFAIVSQIDHPNVVRIFSRGFTDWHAYIAMEYFEGGDLSQAIRAGIPVERVPALLAQVASALAAIHLAGIVHRDLKPENLMLRRDGTLVVADFGIARTSNRGNSSMMTAAIVGTPSYMSPEQAMGARATPASDLYSLGVILHEMLTGRKPYEGKQAITVLDMHVRAPVPELPARLAAFQPFLDRLMAKKPQDRYASAVDALREIRAFEAVCAASDPARGASAQRAA
jgi:CheY-like chemotaxis protein